MAFRLSKQAQSIQFSFSTANSSTLVKKLNYFLITDKGKRSYALSTTPSYCVKGQTYSKRALRNVCVFKYLQRLCPGFIVGKSPNKIRIKMSPLSADFKAGEIEIQQCQNFFFPPKKKISVIKLMQNNLCKPTPGLSSLLIPRSFGLNRGFSTLSLKNRVNKQGCCNFF